MAGEFHAVVEGEGEDQCPEGVHKAGDGVPGQSRGLVRNRLHHQELGDAVDERDGDPLMPLADDGVALLAPDVLLGLDNLGAPGDVGPLRDAAAAGPMALTLARGGTDFLDLPLRRCLRTTCGNLRKRLGTTP